MTDEEKMAIELDDQIEKEMYTELEEKDNLLKEKEERYLKTIRKEQKKKSKIQCFMQKQT